VPGSGEVGSTFHAREGPACWEILLFRRRPGRAWASGLLRGMARVAAANDEITFRAWRGLINGVPVSPSRSPSPPAGLELGCLAFGLAPQHCVQTGNMQINIAASLAGCSRSTWRIGYYSIAARRDVVMRILSPEGERSELDY